MNNDRGQNLIIPRTITLEKGHIYVATLISVEEVIYDDEVKHRFKYQIDINGLIQEVNRNIKIEAQPPQLTIGVWLKRHSNHSVNHTKYEPYIDKKHLVRVSEYNGNYFILDVAPLNVKGDVSYELYSENA